MKRFPSRLRSVTQSIARVCRSYQERKLLFIEEASAHAADVHVVTQIVNSMLGLVVLPWERTLKEKLGATSMTDAQLASWPSWEVSRGSSTTLRELIRFLRNGVAHGNIRFSSDDLEPAGVCVEVSSYTPKDKDRPCWIGCMRADKLREFCLHFISFVEKTLD